MTRAKGEGVTAPARGAITAAELQKLRQIIALAKDLESLDGRGAQCVSLLGKVLEIGAIAQLIAGYMQVPKHDRDPLGWIGYRLLDKADELQSLLEGYACGVDAEDVQ